MKKVFIISGEKSGDLIANSLIQKLQKENHDIKIHGVGGQSFLQNGLVSLFDQKKLSVMGFAEIVPKIKEMLNLIKITKKEIYKFQPSHIITIDSPGFNFQIAKQCQHARFSKREIREILLQDKRAKDSTFQKFTKLHKLYQSYQERVMDFMQKHSITQILLKIFSIFVFFWKKIRFIVYNKYTKYLFKIIDKVTLIVVHSHLVHALFLAFFFQFVGVFLIIKSVIMYLGSYGYLRTPFLIAKKIYHRTLENKEHAKDLSTYTKKVIAKRLYSRNMMFLGIKSIFESLPKWLRFRFIIKIEKFVIKLHKRFKKNSYDKALSCKFYHIVAPSVWAYKKQRAKKVAKLYSTLFCILPFEPLYFQKYNLKTIFIGYPPYFRIQNIIHQSQCNSYTYSEHHSLKKISITVGSRLSELKHHIPIIKKTIEILNNNFPDKLKFFIILLPELKSFINKELGYIKNVIYVEEQDKWDTIRSSDFAIAKSGTNVMEFALLGIASIVYYKSSMITYLIVKNLAYTQYASIINFSTQREILPEFLQNNAHNLHIKAEEWIVNPNLIKEIKVKMNKELEKFVSLNQPEDIILENLCN